MEKPRMLGFGTSFMVVLVWARVRGVERRISIKRWMGIVLNETIESNLKKSRKKSQNRKKSLHLFQTIPNQPPIQ